VTRNLPVVVVPLRPLIGNAVPRRVAQSESSFERISKRPAVIDHSTSSSGPVPRRPPEARFTINCNESPDVAAELQWRAKKFNATRPRQLPFGFCSSRPRTRLAPVDDARLRRGVYTCEAVRPNWFRVASGLATRRAARGHST